MRAGFSLQQCSQAMAQIGALLRDTLREKRVTPEDVMNAMLPALQGAKKIEITEAAVRAAVRKILDAE